MFWAAISKNHMTYQIWQFLPYLQAAPSNLPYFRVWCKKIKILKFGTKNARFLYFRAKIWKTYCHILNQSPRIHLIVKFGAKWKIFKFGTKSALFEYFRAGICKWHWYIWNQHHRSCLIAKFLEKKKMPKFGTKMSYVAIFGLEFV